MPCVFTQEGHPCQFTCDESDLMGSGEGRNTLPISEKPAWNDDQIRSFYSE